jgi:hypothetical protein
VPCGTRGGGETGRRAQQRRAEDSDAREHERQDAEEPAPRGCSRAGRRRRA